MSIKRSSPVPSLCAVVTLFAALAISDTGAVWTSPNPGFKARITQPGLKFINDVGVQLLTEDVKGQSIPDISGTASISIGKVDYTVSSMRITGFSVPTTSLSTQPGVGLRFLASGGSISLHGDWRYKYKKGFIHISDHGSFDASANNLNLNLAVRMGKDGSGRPTIEPAGCTGNIGSLNIKLHGGASWLYNLFSSNIEKSLRNSLNKQICDMVNDEIRTRAASALASMKILTPVGPYTELDYGLVANPVFDSTFMETSHKGEFYPTGKHDKEAPYKVPAIAPSTSKSKMAYMWITDYVINTAGYVFQEIGKLTYNITDDMIPPGSEFRLNTSSIGFLIPQLEKMYPNMLMELVANSTQPPIVTVAKEGVSGRLWADLIAYVVLPGGKRQEAFTLGVVATGNGTVGFADPNVTGKVQTMSAELTLKNSNVGPFSLILIQPAVDILIDTGVIPYLNEKGAKGIPLPEVEGVHFINPEIVLEQDVIKLGTDLKYTP